MNDGNVIADFDSELREIVPKVNVIGTFQQDVSSRNRYTCDKTMRHLVVNIIRNTALLINQPNV